MHELSIAMSIVEIAEEESEKRDDAARLARSLAPVKIITGTLCHLKAAMVQKALDDRQIGELDFLFVENVHLMASAKICGASSFR